MVEEMVVKEALTEEMIAAGKALLVALDANPQIEVTAALWFFFLDNNTWQLVLASPLVGVVGPRQVYKIILSTLADLRMERSTLTLEDIRVVTGDDPLIRIFKVVFGRLDGIHSIRFTRNAVGGQYVEDAYVYRVS